MPLWSSRRPAKSSPKKLVPMKNSPFDDVRIIMMQVLPATETYVMRERT
jgi:hypothetical protein